MMASEPVDYRNPNTPRSRGVDVGFIIVTAVLLLAAVGLNTTIQRMQLTFRKQPVALQKPLKDLSPNLGPWVQVTVDERASHEMEEALATKEYISRDYVDSRIVPRELIEQFKGKKYLEQQQMLDKLRAVYPKAVMHMHIPYYTGLVDTVAHIPDRCYVADGFEPSEAMDSRWGCFTDRGEGALAKFIHFEDQVAGRRAVSRNVAYFFHVNGQYTNSSLEVRRQLQNLFEKHGYYAKIELMTVLNDREAAAAVMDDFLKYALPEVEKVLPDWQKVKAQEKSAGA
jgi:hypothetical protein